MDPYRIEWRDGVAEISLNIGKANALNPQSLVAISRALDEAGARGARGVILTGYDRFFSAGLDLVTLYELDRPTMDAFRPVRADLLGRRHRGDHSASAIARHTVVVPVGDLHRGVVRALQYAKTLSPDARAVFVETDPARTRKLEERWGKWGEGVPLVVLDSPYRSLLGPFLEYLNRLQEQGENHFVTIVIPEFIPARWWQYLLHNQTALLIKGALLFRKNVVVADVPYHLQR